MERCIPLKIYQKIKMGLNLSNGEKKTTHDYVIF